MIMLSLFPGKEYRVESVADWIWKYWYVIVLAITALICILFAVYVYQHRLHSVSLHCNGHITIIRVTHNSTLPVPIPKTDNKFSGWYRDSACTIPFNSSDKIKFDFPLYAKFE